MKNAKVEFDESKFGKRKYNRGHITEGAWVLGAVDRVTKRVVTKQTRKKKLINFNKAL